MYIKNLCGHVTMFRFAINCNKGKRFEDQKVHFNGPKRRKYCTLWVQQLFLPINVFMYYGHISASEHYIQTLFQKAFCSLIVLRLHYYCTSMEMVNAIIWNVHIYPNFDSLFRTSKRQFNNYECNCSFNWDSFVSFTLNEYKLRGLLFLNCILYWHSDKQRHSGSIHCDIVEYMSISLKIILITHNQ